MATQIKNTLSFSLAAGASVVLPHGLNDGGFPQTPDVIFIPTADLTVVSADHTNVTLRNDGAGELEGSILVEWWHTIERAFGDAANLDLSVKPYVVVGSEIPGSAPLPPWPGITQKIIYARTTGSDVTGTGTLVNPYRTFVRAVRDVPSFIPPGVFYEIDITGIGVETLPDDYILPGWKSGNQLRVDDTRPFLSSRGAVTIIATPQLDASIPAASATIEAVNVLAETADPVTGLISIQLTVAAAAAKGWIAGQFSGVPGVSAGLLFGDAAGESAAISGNTADTLFITLTVPVTYPAQILECSATLEGRATGDIFFPRGGITGNHIDSLVCLGIHFRSDDGFSPGIGMLGNFLRFRFCQIERPIFFNCIRDLLFGACYVSEALMETEIHAATSFFDSIILMDYPASAQLAFAECVLDNSTVEANYSVPQAGFPVSNFTLANVKIRNSPSYGIHVTGGNAYIENVVVEGSADNGVQVDNGQGFVKLFNVRGSTSIPPIPNLGDYGLRINDGAFVEVDAATNAAGAAGNEALSGAVDDLSVGGLPDIAWPAAGAFNYYDITAVGAGGAAATDTGSRLFQNP